MDVDIQAKLQGIGTLGKIAGTTGSGTLDGEGVVFGVCKIPSPERDDDRTEIVISMGTECGIELLRIGVGLIPPGLALTSDIGAKRKLTDMVPILTRTASAGFIPASCRILPASAVWCPGPSWILSGTQAM